MTRRSSRLLPIASLLVALSPLLLPPLSHAQGCTQCLDNTAATPGKTQAAYRHAIEFMTITAGSLFVGTIALLRRFR
jgi:hypothetical protein